MNIQNTELYALGAWPAVVLGAVVILVLTALCSSVCTHFLLRVFERRSKKQISGSIFKNILLVVIWCLGLGCMLFICFGIDPTVLWGALGIGGIALSLGMQNTVSNLIGGLQVSFSQEINIGDWISISTISGQVKDITWRKMMVLDAEGNLHNIPNSLLGTSIVSRLTDYASVTCSFLLDKDTDFETYAGKLTAQIAQALEAAGMLYEHHTPVFYLSSTQFGGVCAAISCHILRSASAKEAKNLIMNTGLAALKSN